MEYKKVNQNINNIVNDQVRKLESIFPSVVKDGEVDFEALKEELGRFEEAKDEKYELTWAGKKKAKKIVQEEIIGRTLKFIPEDSKDADITENLYIEGDNLEVLKLLHQNYYGAVKMIFIDPPYNTGHDFLYNDDFSIDDEQSLIDEGIISENGEKLSINLKSTNRFHAKWLSMMYSRLKVAKDLLQDDGVIFITLDDTEIDNLRKICNEIFGEDNFVSWIVWQHSIQPKGYLGTFSIHHNHILCYAKSSSYVLQSLDRTEEDNKAYSNPDNDPRGPWRSGDVRNALYRPNLIYDIVTPSGKIIKPCSNGWRWRKETLQEKISTGEIIFSEDQTRIIRKIYLDTLVGRAPESIWFGKDVGTTREAMSELKKLFEVSPFDTPKPSKLIKRMLQLIEGKDGIVMDFFAGSCSTADAVMQKNAEDGGKRKFIMVQLREKCDEKSEAYKQGYKNICEIGKERIRRAGDKILSENPSANIDTGFKVFRTADTNIKWNSLMDMGQVDMKQLEYTPDLVDFMPGANDIDIVYELMLRQRDVALSETLERLSNIGNRTYLYASSYLVCLETTITEDLLSKLSKLDPLPIKFIFRDSAFKDDISLKDEAFRRLKAFIEKNAGTSKPTYTVEFI